jgi:uncharacterized protein DUF4160
MPTVLRERGYRFYFYSNDRDEPPHVHVQRERKMAKFWLEPIICGPTYGFRGAELTEIYRLIAQHQELLLQRWYDFFGD